MKRFRFPLTLVALHTMIAVGIFIWVEHNIRHMPPEEEDFVRAPWFILSPAGLDGPVISLFRALKSPFIKVAISNMNELAIHSIFGGIQWFLIGLMLAYVKNHFTKFSLHLKTLAANFTSLLRSR